MLSLNKFIEKTINYSQWNAKIATHFFNQGMSGRSVYLFVTEDLINSLGASEGVSCQDFIQAAKNSIGTNGVCQKALSYIQDPKWRYKRQGYPPYIGYLALFVLAAGSEGDFSCNAYYPRLRELLGEEAVSRPCSYPDFDKMQALWKDLEKWANVDKSGELGFFSVNITGRLVHVGIPISQTLLTERELKALPFIFAEAGLEPISPPSENYLALLLVKYGCNYLRRRTINLLGASQSDELRQALIERIIDELSHWDGIVKVSCEATSSKEKNKIYGILRLCFKLDSIAKTATFSIRCVTKYDFPENGLNLNINKDDCFCDEHANGWSSYLRWKFNKKNINASQLDWLQGSQMESADEKWCFKLPASPIRIFVEGKSIGLPGIIEVGQIPKGLPFYLLAHQQCSSLLEKWGTSSCEGFNRLEISKGLPRGWSLFKINAVFSDEIIKKSYPILSCSTSERLYLEGGIRIDKRNYFFKFAPPKLILQAIDKSLKLYCNGHLLKSCDGGSIYELPSNIPSDKKIEIEARRDNDIIKRLHLYLGVNFSLETFSVNKELAIFNYLGHLKTNLDKDFSGVTGALVQKFNCSNFNFNTLLPVQGKQSIIFVGKEPGQVAIYPKEALPVDWHPVWAIAKGQLFDRVIFCGNSLKESEPNPSKNKDNKKFGLWKQILSANHKRTLPPFEDIRQKQLWERYQKEAKRVCR
jgi:hypothetical protein